MGKAEFNAVLELPGSGRYRYCLDRIAETGRVWSLKQDDGWVLMADGDGREVVPIWPDEAFAAACATDEFAGSTPRPIDLEDWTEAWMPGLTEDGRLIAVFPTPANDGVVVEPDQFEADLDDAMAG